MRACNELHLIVGVAAMVFLFVFGGVYLTQGNMHCNALSTLVTDISRNPSSLPTGNSVVHFDYNATADLLPRTCSVALHNTWLDKHTKNHYPVGKYVDIYDCSINDDNTCETDESLQYLITKGTWLVVAGAVLLVLETTFCLTVCCRHCNDDPVSPRARADLDETALCLTICCRDCIDQKPPSSPSTLCGPSLITA
jgi:hypothetical protein